MNRTKYQDYLIQSVISQVIAYIAEDNDITSQQALEAFFGTELPKKIEDVESGYYRESPSYIYEIFKERQR